MAAQPDFQLRDSCRYFVPLALHMRIEKGLLCPAAHTVRRLDTPAINAQDGRNSQCRQTLPIISRRFHPIKFDDFPITSGRRTRRGCTIYAMLKHVRELLPGIAGDPFAMPPDPEQSGATVPKEDELEQNFNVLRRHSAADIQNAFSEALEKLTGKKLRTTIMRIDHSPKWAGPTAGKSELVLRIERPAWRPSPDEDSPEGGKDG